MIRHLFYAIILTISLNANTTLFEKIENLMGSQEYNTHKNLVQLIFRDTKTFYINERLNYLPILKQLNHNGLLKLELSEPKEITIEFKTNAKPIKSLKILNDTLKSLGYYYYFTKKTKYDGSGNLVWTIRLKTMYAVDPLILSTQLAKYECKIVDITRKPNDTWVYSINTKHSNIFDAVFIDTNEKVVLQKPLKPYFLKINEAKTLKVISRTLNNWYPHIVFYDKDLNVLEIIKRDSRFGRFSARIPKTTQYIKITDLYTLINIKRGLSIITKE